MARKPTGSARAEAPSRARAKDAETPKTQKNGKAQAQEQEAAPAVLSDAARESRAKKLDGGRFKSAAAAREALLERGDAALGGASTLRSDPLSDAQAARALADAVEVHAVELSRRGLSPYLTEAALALAQELEAHLQGLGAAAMAARARSAETAELLADAAQSAQAVREAIGRVTRGAAGRSVAHAFGLGEAFNARQPAHVLRALRRILAGAKEEAAAAADAGLLADDLTTLRGLAEELAAVPGAEGAGSDSSEKLHRAHAALRAWFDLVGAKATLALVADPGERARVLGLIPRAGERRQHLRRAEGA